MSDDRTLAPMALDTILPMIRTLHALQERAGAKERAAERGDAGGVEEYHSAAMLEERIRQPITVAGRVLEPCGDRDMRWYHSDVMLTARCDEWCAVLTTHGEPDTAIQVQTQGRGPTIAAALADAQARYSAAIPDTLLRMGGLLPCVRFAAWSTCSSAPPRPDQACESESITRQVLPEPEGPTRATRARLFFLVAGANRLMSVPHERVVRAIAVALDDERRQTQRRMIAALYWRAGAIRLACHTHPYASPMWWGSIADSDAILAEAVRMEAACAR